MVSNSIRLLVQLLDTTEIRVVIITSIFRIKDVLAMLNTRFRLMFMQPIIVTAVQL